MRIKAREGTVVIDPYALDFGLTLPKLKADVLCISHEHSDHNNIEAVRGNPFVIRGSGEYHVKGVYVHAIEGFHDDKSGAERGSVTMFLILLENVNVAHLSDIGQPELTSQQLAALGTVDVLFIPVGGLFTIDAKAAGHIVNQIEPKVIIPIHYDIPGLSVQGKEHLLSGVDSFLKEVGVKTEALPEAKITLSTLPQEGTIVNVLTPLGSSESAGK